MYVFVSKIIVLGALVNDVFRLRASLIMLNGNIRDWGAGATQDISL